MCNILFIKILSSNKSQIYNIKFLNSTELLIVIY